MPKASNYWLENDMRLRNVKHAKHTIEDNSNIVILDPRSKKGEWNQVFENENPIHLEIGCGKGRFIYELAKRNPNTNYIGIEKFDSVIIRALEKIIEEPLDNIRLIRIDAENLEDVFDICEISRIYLNFSDPWPKTRTAKRRLTSQKFLARYQNILQDSSEIRFKTDNFDLFQFSMMELNSHPSYDFEEITMNLYKNLPIDNIQTEFEERFVNMGNQIFFLKVKYKRSES